MDVVYVGVHAGADRWRTSTRGPLVRIARDGMSRTFRTAFHLAAGLAAILLAVPAAAQQPDSAAAALAPSRPVVRNAFGGIERREPLGLRGIALGNVVAQSALAAGRGAAEGVPARRLPAVALGGAVAGAGFYGAKRLGRGAARRRRVRAGLRRGVARRERRRGRARALARPPGAGPARRARGDAVGRGRAAAGPPMTGRAWARGGAAERGRGRRAAAARLPPALLRRRRLLPRRGSRARRARRPPLPPAGSDDRARRAAVAAVRRRTEAHEGVHVVQAMQVSAATPGGTLRTLAGWRSRRARRPRRAHGLARAARSRGRVLTRALRARLERARGLHTRRSRHDAGHARRARLHPGPHRYARRGCPARAHAMRSVGGGTTPTRRSMAAACPRW